MSDREKMEADGAMDCRIAGTLIYEARLKDFEAACWVGLETNIEEARANAHSGFVAALDAVLANVRAVKAQFRKTA